MKVATHEWVKDLLKKIKARGGFGGGTGTQGPPGPKGADGATGPQGPAGADGFTPTITAATVPEGVRLTITNKSGQSTATVPKGADGARGPGANWDSWELLADIDAQSKNGRVTFAVPLGEVALATLLLTHNNITTAHVFDPASIIQENLDTLLVFGEYAPNSSSALGYIAFNYCVDGASWIYDQDSQFTSFKIYGCLKV